MKERKTDWMTKDDFLAAVLLKHVRNSGTTISLDQIHVIENGGKVAVIKDGKGGISDVFFENKGGISQVEK